MNHHQQENRPAPGGRQQRQSEAPSQTERQAARERDKKLRDDLPSDVREDGDPSRVDLTAPLDDEDRPRVANSAQALDDEGERNDRRRDHPGLD